MERWTDFSMRFLQRSWFSKISHIRTEKELVRSSPMAFSAITTGCSLFLPLTQNSPSSSSPQNSVSFRLSPLKVNGRKPISIRAVSVSGTLSSSKHFCHFVYTFNDLFFLSFVTSLDFKLVNLKEYVIFILSFFWLHWYGVNYWEIINCHFFSSLVVFFPLFFPNVYRGAPWVIKLVIGTGMLET